MNERSILSFELEEKQKEEFLKHGITEYSSLTEEQLTSFLQQLELPPIIHQIHELPTRNDQNLHFHCSITSLDETISPFLPGVITEICGLPGSGRTTLCLRYAENHKTLWIDTEGCLIPPKIHQISVLRILDHIQFFSLIYSLPNLVSEFQPELIVIDSVAATLRGIAADDGARTALLWEFLKVLRIIAAKTGIAVLLTNHMSKLQFHGFIPTLGPSWTHAPTHNFELRRRGDERVLRILKSPVLPKIEIYLVSDYLTENPY